MKKPEKNLFMYAMHAMPGGAYNGTIYRYSGTPYAEQFLYNDVERR